MIFNEVYGAYIRTIGLIINEAIKNSSLTWKDISDITTATAFSESPDYIKELLNPSESTPAFPLINKDPSTRKYTTILSKPYNRPITIYELRWLKAISQDPRIKLFCDDFPKLEEVEPLFNPGDIIYYDQNLSGDDFEKPNYIAVFRTIIKALHDKREIEITKNDNTSFPAIPKKLEYSQKDNRFRLVTRPKEGKESNWYVNLSAINNVKITDKAIPTGDTDTEKSAQTVVLEITDEKAAMERICLSFSHLERTTERIDNSRYRMTLTYDQSDTAEMIIRIMSLGRYVKVLEPEEIKEEIRSRLKSQMSLFS